MAAEITGSGDSSTSSGYVLDLTWSNSSGGGVTYSHDSTSGGAHDTVEITHGLGTRNVIVDVIDLQSSSSDNLNDRAYDGVDIGHTQHVVVNRNGDNTVKLFFNGARTTGWQYKILVQKVG